MNKEYLICVDDEVIVLQSLKQELKADPFFKDVVIEVADSAARALELVHEIHDDGGTLMMMISDQRMPVMNGDALLLEVHKLAADALKILLTGYSDLDAVVRLVNGDVLYRYLSKPWDRQDLRLTLHEACRTFRQRRLIFQQAARIEHLTMAMVTALESANFFFDEDTGQHILRIAQISAFVAEKAGLDADMVKQIRIYAPLHDIGKVGVGKDVLLKPGALTDEEFNRIREHVIIGHRIIDSEAIDSVAKNIVLYHHEKWNGNGYLEGLQGPDIPVEARVVSIADVLDALVSQRVYKPAYPLADALDIVRSERGKSFDPVLIDAFFDNLPAVDTYQQFLEALTG